MDNIEKIEKDGVLLAIIYRANLKNEKEINFITPDYFPLQVGIQTKEKSSKAPAHKHKPYSNLVTIDTQEIFYVDTGKIEVEVYDKEDNHFQNVIVNSGELIVLNSGHGVRFLEKTRMIEIKQGPYRGAAEEKEFIGK